jgi:NADH-quinone oxidoreductase subunit G
MSAQPQQPAIPPDHVAIEIDGQSMVVPKGSMIIHAADKAGISIPRFCYHDKLPIAANCRMCLVDVEKAPKPMPACATPVMDGMKVYTQSKRALDSQRNVMEFLLINHPLDCPICDQGGECELQDVAMGYGRSVSRFSERKRVVADEDMGALIATDMTRCIHCTRCVRFVSEIAGTYELGGMGRGEHLEIGTYIGKSLESELSGNIVDVCPVGALTNKVFRFRARAWELTARASIGYHDALGSNLYLHTRRGEVLRCVPRNNDALNECWLSDRDRYSHQGLYADDRAMQPMLRKGDALVEVSWDEAIAAAAAGLKGYAGDQIGALISPMSSSEEGHLLAQLLRALDSDHIDHRLRTLDFADSAAGATFELPLARVEQAGAILIVGSDVRRDQPMLGHRVRKAFKRGARVDAINSVDFDFHFDLSGKRIVDPWHLVDELAALAQVAAADASEKPGTDIAGAIEHAQAQPAHRDMVARLRAASISAIVFGDNAVQHPQSSLLRALSRYVARATDSAFNEIASGPNAVGLTRAGAVPRGKGLHAAAQMQQPRKAQIVYNVQALDCAEPAAFEKMRRAATFVLAFSSYLTPGLKQSAHVVLPIGLPPEIDGSYANVNGGEQVCAAGAKAPGETRAGWRVLRALGGALGIAGFDFDDIDTLRARMRATPTVVPALSGVAPRRDAPAGGVTRIATVAPYAADGVLRRSAALQATPLAPPPRVVMHPGDALALGLVDIGRARISDGTNEVVLPLHTSASVPHGCAWIEAGHAETAMLKGHGAKLTVTRA